MTITAVVLTHNNQSSIKSLHQQLSWCDQIIVVDDQSTDATVKLARRLDARVFIRPLKDNFAAQRNFGLKQVTTDWAFFIDTDEVVTSKLAAEITTKINSPIHYSAYSLRRLDVFLGKTLRFGETGHIHLVRLARRTAGRWQRPVHETWQIKLPIGTLKSPLYHYPHPTLTNFLTKINHYTTIESKYRPVPGQAQLLFEFVFFPPTKFFYNYILKLGFLDGLPGLVMALMMSWHSLLVRVKLYEKTFPRPLIRPNSR